MTISQPKLQQLHARLDRHVTKYSHAGGMVTRRDLRDLVACFIDEPKPATVGVDAAVLVLEREADFTDKPWLFESIALTLVELERLQSEVERLRSDKDRATSELNHAHLMMRGNENVIARLRSGQPVCWCVYTSEDSPWLVTPNEETAKAEAALGSGRSVHALFRAPPEMTSEIARLSAANEENVRLVRERDEEIARLRAEAKPEPAGREALVAACREMKATAERYAETRTGGVLESLLKDVDAVCCVLESEPDLAATTETTRLLGVEAALKRLMVREPKGHGGSRPTFDLKCRCDWCKADDALLGHVRVKP